MARYVVESVLPDGDTLQTGFDHPDEAYDHASNVGSWNGVVAIRVFEVARDAVCLDYFESHGEAYDAYTRMIGRR